MASFTDTKGRTWTVDITVRDIKRLRPLKVEVGDFLKDNLKHLGEVVANVEQVVGAAFVLCSEQADARNITEDDFASGLGGDTLDALRDAFVEAVADFSPSRVRPTIRALMKKSDEILQTANSIQIERLAAMTPEAMRKLVELYEKSEFSKPATVSPESPASIPTVGA